MDSNVNISDFMDENNNILGRGNFGFVRKMKNKNNGLYYAVKTIKKQNDNTNTNNEKKNFFREIFIQKNLFHNNIIHLLCSFEDNENYYLVMDYFPGKTLKDIIENKKKKNNSLFTEKEIISIFEQILNGVQFIHNNSIIHRDIKPDNILLDENNIVKITDFGISALINSNINNNNYNKDLFCQNTVVGPLNYISPEIKEGKEQDFKCDIYSLGITIFYLMNYNLPHYDEEVDGELQRKSNDNFLNPIYSFELRKLIMKMISENPKDRPTTQQALNHLLNHKNKIINLIKNKPFYDYSQNKYKIEKLLNSGNFADVYKAKKDNNYYAIKYISKLNDEVNYNQIVRERELNKRLNHINIVHLVDSFENDLYYFLVMEYIPNRSLEYYISKKKSLTIKEEKIIPIFKQIIRGLICIHDNNIMHRDIKPDNILFDNNNIVKIADFGLATLFKTNTNVNEDPALFDENKNVGHKDYVCPEIVNEKPYDLSALLKKSSKMNQDPNPNEKNKNAEEYNYSCPEIIDGKPYDFKCDIFSLGIVIFYLMSFKLPYTTYFDDNKKIRRKRENIILNEYIYSKYLIYLVNNMISEDPDDRLTTKEIDYELELIDKLKDENPIEISSLLSLIRVFYSIEELKYDLIEKKINNNYE